MNYVRFITPRWRLRRVEADCGPFGPAYDALYERDVPEVLRVAIGREICPCSSGKRFQALLHAFGPVSMGPSGIIIGGKS
jgi:hypothetical protein